MPHGTCGVMCFGLKGDKKEAVTFMDHLQLINIVTHVADAKILFYILLAIHIVR